MAFCSKLTYANGGVGTVAIVLLIHVDAESNLPPSGAGVETLGVAVRLDSSYTQPQEAMPL